MIRTRVGYAGGTAPSPTYHALGDHTESFEVLYDPRVISYSELLALFWKDHDPRYNTTYRQYRNAVFTQGPEQARLATASREALGASVQTAIEPLTTFTPAEDYHQKYYLRRNRELVKMLAGLTANERAFMDSTAAARLNAYYGQEATLAQVEAALRELPLAAPEVERVLALLSGKAASPTCRK